MGKKEDKKGEQEIADSGDVPLVFVNEGAKDDRGKKDKAIDRKRSRVFSTVSMESSKDEEQAQDSAKVRIEYLVTTIA